jgi:hypothetical protein
MHTHFALLQKAVHEISSDISLKGTNKAKLRSKCMSTVFFFLAAILKRLLRNIYVI